MRLRAQVRCLEYALANGADVTLNSYGGLNADSSALKTAIGVAEARGQLFVTAAGNDYGVPGLLYLHACFELNHTSLQGTGSPLHSAQNESFEPYASTWLARRPRRML